jgi:hypothetical protein
MPGGEKGIVLFLCKRSFSLKTDDAEPRIAGVDSYPDFQKDCVPDRNRAGPDGTAVSVLSETVMAWVEYN